MHKKAIIFLLSTINSLSAGFLRETLVKTSESYIEIQELAHKNDISSLDLKSNRFYCNELEYIFTTSTTNYYCIDLPNDTIKCSENQRII